MREVKRSPRRWTRLNGRLQPLILLKYSLFSELISLFAVLGKLPEMARALELCAPPLSEMGSNPQNSL
jgi:hypothetical protein